MLRFTSFFLCLILLTSQVVIGQERGLGLKTYGGGLSAQLVGDSGKRKVALVVGVSNYSSEALRLKYAERDARLFRDYLVEVRAFPVPNIFFLPDSLATAGKIYNQVRACMQVLTAGDELVIYFAGHGDVQTVDDFSEAFLLAWDASGSRNYKGAGGVVDMEDFQRYTNHLATRKKVQVSLVLDACHSGFDQYRDGILKAQQAISEQFQSINKWTGCGLNELSFEADSIQHGLFTWYLVQGLMGLADDPMDNFVTGDELTRFVRGKVSQATFGKQNPELSIPAGAGVQYPVSPEIREKAFAYFRSRQFNQSFASRGTGAASDTSRNRDLLPYIDRYNRLLLQEKYYGGDSSALSVIRAVGRIETPSAKELEAGLKNHLADVLETRSQLVLNEFLKGKSQLPPSSRFYIAGIESALADSLLDAEDPRRKTNQVMSAFHKSYSYIRYEQFEKYNEADHLLRQAIALEPKAAYLYVALAQLMSERAQYDSAMYYARKAASIIPTWTHPQNQLGNQFEALYRYDDAIRQFEKTIQIDSNYSWSYNNIGLAYKNMGRLTEAESYFMRSLQMKGRTKSESIERDLAISYNNLGAIYDDREQFARAESYYRQALEVDSTYTQPLRNLSEMYSSYDGVEAEFLLKQAIRIMPYQADNYRYLADFYRNYPTRSGVLDSAAQFYQLAMQLNPYDPWAYIGMAWLVQDKNKPESGLYWLRAGMRWASRNSDLIEGVAQYFEQSQLPDSAHHYYRMAMQLNPYDHYISGHYADFLLTNRDTVNAERILLSQIDLLYNTPKYVYGLGDFYYRIGNLSKAIDAYQRVVSIDSLYQPAWEALAYLFLDLGRSAESIQTLERLKKFDGFDEIKRAFLYRVGELSLFKKGSLKAAWLDRFAGIDPNNQYIAALRLEASYFNLETLRKTYDSMRSLLDRAENYSDEWLKWMLLSAIELSEVKQSKQLAAQYLQQVIFSGSAIRAVALQLVGDCTTAVQTKSLMKKTDLSGFGPIFKKIFSGL